MTGEQQATGLDQPPRLFTQPSIPPQDAQPTACATPSPREDVLQQAGRIAHDFNNHLGGIIGAADLLQTQLTDPRHRQLVARILQAAERSATLTQQLLAIARKDNVRAAPVSIQVAATPTPTVPVTCTRVISGRGRILIADDEPILRQVMEVMLQKLGYTVVACADGEEALSYYQQHGQTIDLVILDMVMPKCNGQESFRAMRAINPAIRALLVSGYTLAGEEQSALQAGVCGFIKKPFTITPLSQQVAAALRNTATGHS